MRNTEPALLLEPEGRFHEGHEAWGHGGRALVLLRGASFAEVAGDTWVEACTAAAVAYSAAVADDIAAALAEVLCCPSPAWGRRAAQ